MALSIRRAVAADAAAFTRMMSDPGVYGGTMQMPYPMEDRWRTVLVEQAQPGRHDLYLVAERGGEVVGSASLGPAGTSIRRRHAMTLGIFVAPEAQRAGVGTALMAAVCDYADRWVGLLRIELTVYADNEVAQRLYRRFGFEVEGCMGAYVLRDGQYVDALAMARFHPRPPSAAQVERNRRLALLEGRRPRPGDLAALSEEEGVHRLQSKRPVD